MTKLTSRNGTLEFGPGYPTVLVNDQLRVLDQSPDVLAELSAGRLDRMLELARWGQEVGMDMVDILVNHPDLDEVELLPRIARAVHQEIGCPISLDSRSPAALEAALLALRPNKVLINSVSAERESLAALLPLAKAYGAAIVGMPVGHQYGMPLTVEGRLSEARTILQAAEQYGISREDIVLDGICLASSAVPGSMQVTLETLRAFHEEFGVATVLGIGNAGYGMPDPTQVDLAFLLAAIPWGLDVALVNPATPSLVPAVRAMDFLAGRDAYGRRYIQYYRARRKG